MWNTRTFIGSTLAATVVALAGCDATMFANVNSSLTQFKTATKAAGSAVVPAAAIAATMGGVQLAKAMADKSAGIIAAGGGNLIATGSGNYALLAIEKLQDENNVTEAQYEWVDGGTKDGTVNTTIKEFSCKSQGYFIKAKGAFHYTPNKAAAAEPYILFQAGGKDKTKGTFKAEMTGEVHYQDKPVVRITKLDLGAGHPVPEDGKLADFIMESTATGDDYVKIEASAEAKAGKINVVGTSQVGTKGVPKPITFDELNTNGTVVDAQK